MQQEKQTAKKIELKSLTEIEGKEKNPFVVELKDKMYLQPRANTIVARGQGIVDTSSGELINESLLIGKRKIVDKSQFAKIYASEIMELFNLSKSALSVFLYLTKVMDYDNKAMLIYQKEYKKLGYKTQYAALKGLRELISADIIYPHILNGLWWLNPIYVCKGERFAKYTEYVTEDWIKGQDEAMLKKQSKEQIERLDHSTDGKLTKALNEKTITENGNLMFPDKSPYEK